MERCSTPRWGLEAPDPIDLILKEKMGVRGIRPRMGLGDSLFFSTNCRVLWRHIERTMLQARYGTRPLQESHHEQSDHCGLHL